MKFSKMHGLGNDFIILDGINHEVNRNYATLARKLCDRHQGVGADGILIILPSENADLRMRIINADGSEANMCGNGIRCFAKYVYEKGLINMERFTVETFAGIMEPELMLEDGKVVSVKVNMGKPGLFRKEVPMLGPAGQVINEYFSIDRQIYRITSLLMGVPHTIVFVNDFEEAELSKVGPLIEQHPSFPKGTNVDFVKVLNYREIAVRTWERGAGRTLACGTGCCAAVVAAVLNKKTGRNVLVHLDLGELQIEWRDDQTVYMSGPAVEVFTGTAEEISYVNKDGKDESLNSKIG